ncbi:hypothetical protein LUW77_16160 [Streptomyces radiopugnans]|nr:hypothetical protein LUW77_16160 [Streptomyces radiopugnans]
MAEVREFALPDLGEGLTEAEIVRWLVSVGDVVAVDQPVVEVETAKAMVEVPCPYGGVVTARFGEEGAEVPVGAPLVTVAVGASAATAGEPAGDGSGAPAAGSAASVSGSGSGAGSGETAGASEKSGNVLVGYGTGAPAARRRLGPPGERCARLDSRRGPRLRTRHAHGARRTGPRRPGGGAVRARGDPLRRRTRPGDLATGAAARAGARDRSAAGRLLRPAGTDPARRRRARGGGGPGRARARRRARPRNRLAPPTASGSRCAGCAVRSPTSSPPPGARSPTPPAGWTPTPPNCSPPGGR